MSNLVLHAGSFHPLENFGAGGLGYEGDNRNFSTSGVRDQIARSSGPATSTAIQHL